jgi:hypothetical protein
VSKKKTKKIRSVIVVGAVSAAACGGQVIEAEGEANGQERSQRGGDGDGAGGNEAVGSVYVGDTLPPEYIGDPEYVGEPIYVGDPYVTGTGGVPIYVGLPVIGTGGVGIVGEPVGIPPYMGGMGGTSDED